MDYKTKLSQLETAIEVKKRSDDTKFTCFTDTAPESLKDLFLGHYEVRDLDYKIFSQAIDVYIEAWQNNEESPTLLQDYIEENYNDFANPYNAVRLSYLNVWNDSEIADRFTQGMTISEACAQWYNSQVIDAIALIHEWVTTD